MSEKARDERLKAALRENLRKRKMQARQRSAKAEDAGQPGEAAPGENPAGGAKQDPGDEAPE